MTAVHLHTLPTAAVVSSPVVKCEAPERRIADLAQELSLKMRSALEQIEAINVESRMLSLNAQIEAARSKAAGVAFGVVATAMRNLSGATSEVARRVADETGGMIEELKVISRVLATNVRGTRLADLALTNIDLIDRNLYERSCDVRWWATDSSLVNALMSPSPEAFQYASERMRVILNAYTVYFDLVLVNTDGTVVANGRPDRYPSVHSNHRTSEWFQNAMATKSGDEFGFADLHESSLVNREKALIYSAAVREDGAVKGRIIGALGVVFKWDNLAQTIVENTPIHESEKAHTRVCIVDASCRVLADSHRRALKERLQIPSVNELLLTDKHYRSLMIGEKEYCVAHARSPGFETYATGWHSIILQEMV